MSSLGQVRGPLNASSVSHSITWWFNCSDWEHFRVSTATVQHGKCVRSLNIWIWSQAFHHHKMHEHHALDYTCIPLCVLLISQTCKKSTIFFWKRHPVNSEEALVGLNNGKGDCLWRCSCGEWGSHEYRQLFSPKSTRFEMPHHSYKSPEALLVGKTEPI